MADDGNAAVARAIRSQASILDKALIGDDDSTGIAAVFDNHLHGIKQSLDRLGAGDAHSKGAIELLAISVERTGERIGQGLDNLASAIREAFSGGSLKAA